MPARNADPAPPVRPASVRIRRAGMADLDVLVDLENRAFSHDRLSRRQWRHHLASARTLILVAREDDGPALAAAVVFFHASHDIARLYSLAVAPEARGRGLGERVLVAAEREATRQGSRRMRLEVRRANEAAQRLYRLRDFRLTGARRGYYEDGHDALCYEKTLRGRRAAAPA